MVDELKFVPLVLEEEEKDEPCLTHAVEGKYRNNLQEPPNGILQISPYRPIVRQQRVKDSRPDP